MINNKPLSFRRSLKTHPFTLFSQRLKPYKLRDCLIENVQVWKPGLPGSGQNLSQSCNFMKVGVIKITAYWGWTPLQKFDRMCKNNHFWPKIKGKEFKMGSRYILSCRGRSDPRPIFSCFGTVCNGNLKKNHHKGAFKYYVITFLAFLGPPTTSLMIYGTVNHQKLPFSDPTHPPLWWRNTWMVPNLAFL